MGGTHLLAQACGQHLFAAMKTYAQTWCTRIMESPERELVIFSERARAVVDEKDLEANFFLVKEATLACFEYALQQPLGDTKEIPNLSEFEARLGNHMARRDTFVQLCALPRVPSKSGCFVLEAALLLLSLRSNFHTELHHRRGGKGQIRELCQQFCTSNYL